MSINTKEVPGTALAIALASALSTAQLKGDVYPDEQFDSNGIIHWESRSGVHIEMTLNEKERLGTARVSSTVAGFRFNERRLGGGLIPLWNVEDPIEDLAGFARGAEYQALANSALTIALVEMGLDNSTIGAAKLGERFNGFAGKIEGREYDLATNAGRIYGGWVDDNDAWTPMTEAEAATCAGVALGDSLEGDYAALFAQVIERAEEEFSRLFELAS